MIAVVDSPMASEALQLYVKKHPEEYVTYISDRNLDVPNRMTYEQFYATPPPKKKIRHQVLILDDYLPIFEVIAYSPKYESEDYCNSWFYETCGERAIYRKLPMVYMEKYEMVYIAAYRFFYQPSYYYLCDVYPRFKRMTVTEELTITNDVTRAFKIDLPPVRDYMIELYYPYMSFRKKYKVAAINLGTQLALRNKVMNGKLDEVILKEGQEPKRYHKKPRGKPPHKKYTDYRYGDNYYELTYDEIEEDEEE